MSSLTKLRQVVLSRCKTVYSNRRNDAWGDSNGAYVSTTGRNNDPDTQPRKGNQPHVWLKLRVGRVCQVCQRTQATDEFDDTPDCPGNSRK